MDCNETRQWLDAYVDDELDLARAMETEEHLETCAACSTARQQRQALRSSIKSAGLTWRCPDGLRTSMESIIRREVSTNNTRPIAPRWWLAVAASLVLIAGAAWLAQQSMFSGSASRLIAQQ